MQPCLPTENKFLHGKYAINAAINSFAAFFFQKIVGHEMHVYDHDYQRLERKYYDLLLNNMSKIINQLFDNQVPCIMFTLKISVTPRKSLLLISIPINTVISRSGGTL